MMPLRVSLGALLLALVYTPAVAHDAPSGWSYSASCCDTQDCHPVAPGEVVETPRGYRVPASGETIPYTDRRIKPSGDSGMHRCSFYGFPDAGTICLYVPAGS
jgi:hypothetical protein